MKRKLTNEEVEKLIDNLQFSPLCTDCDKCVLCSRNNGSNEAESCIDFTGATHGGPCDAIKVALKSKLLSKEEEEMQKHDFVIHKVDKMWCGSKKAPGDSPNDNIVTFAETPLGALKALLKEKPLPTRDEVVLRLSKIVDTVKAEFPNAHIGYDGIDRCWIEMDSKGNPNRQTSKPIPYRPPWIPRYDGTELVLVTNEDRPARKGDEVWYLWEKGENIYRVKPTRTSTNTVKFKNVTPVRPEDLE